MSGANEALVAQFNLGPIDQISFAVSSIERVLPSYEALFNGHFTVGDGRSSSLRPRGPSCARRGVSSACQQTGEAYATGVGRFARTVVGETVGWTAADPTNTDPDDVACHLNPIRATDGYRIPENLYEEIEFMAEASGRWGT